MIIYIVKGYIFVTDDEVDADEEHNERKGKHLESLRKEISEWKKLVASTPELSGSRTTESVQDIFKNFERILTEEQLHYIRSAVDYNKWLTESNEFRKRIAYYLEKRKYNSMSNDAEEDILNRIEAAATTDFVDHFAFSHLPE